MKVRTSTKAGRVRQMSCLQKKERKREVPVWAGVGGGGQGACGAVRRGGGQRRGQGKQPGFKGRVGSHWGF